MLTDKQEVAALHVNTSSLCSDARVDTKGAGQLDLLWDNWTRMLSAAGSICYLVDV